VLVLVVELEVLVVVVALLHLGVLLVDLLHQFKMKLTGCIPLVSEEGATGSPSPSSSSPCSSSSSSSSPSSTSSSNSSVDV
jgi:cytoskeletal protein RodZ